MNWLKFFTPQNFCSFLVPFSRLCFSLLISTTFLSSPLLAKKAQPERLSDYLLTSKQLRALNPAEQVHYIAFLYHFTAAIEMLENSSKTSEYAQHSSSSRFNSYVYLSRFLTPEAQAEDGVSMLLGKGLPLEPLISIGRGLPNSGRDFSTAGTDMYRHINEIPCADQFSPANMNKVTDKGLRVTSIPCLKPSLQSNQIEKKGTESSVSSPKSNIGIDNMEFKKFEPQHKQSSPQSVEKKAKLNKNANEPPCAPKGIQPYNTTTLPDGTWGSYGPPCLAGAESSTAKSNDPNPQDVRKAMAGDSQRDNIVDKKNQLLKNYTRILQT